MCNHLKRITRPFKGAYGPHPAIALLSQDMSYPYVLRCRQVRISPVAAGHIGFKVEKINPAFTSQECPKCHTIDSKNRKDQAHFVCTKCGYKRNADYVGSVNIRNRRSISSINIYTPYKSVQGLIRAFYGLDQPLSNKPHYSPAISSKSSAKKRRLITIKEEC